MSATPSGPAPRTVAVTRRTGRRALLGVVCAGLAVALAGCAEDPDAGTNGVGKLPATKIEAKARAAAQSAGTVRLSGSFVSQGDTYKLDMHLTGSGAKGRLTTRKSTFALLRVGDALYLKADAAFWAGEKAGGGGNDASAADKLGGKYVKVPATDPVYKRFSGFTDKDTLLASLLALRGTLATGDHATVGGVKTIRVAGGGGSGGTLDVSLEGTPYPLRLERGGDAGTVRFDDWDKGVSLKPPSRDQIVDYGKQVSTASQG
ncbi:hypothetical protein [Streptomyces sp. NPDC014733]|uniref:hypothetical protein n=1 Tax=Streptomyces sp. NPDC014733 TaxID=3364885 RepID=UPI0037035952